MLLNMCARNQPCQLVYRTSSDRKIHCNVRLLHIAEDQIILDMPMDRRRPIILPPGQNVRLYFLWKKQRYTATTTVITKQKWPADASNALPALVVRYPDGIEKAQRRECFRLSLVHLPSAPVLLRWLTDLNAQANTPEATAETAREVLARLDDPDSSVHDVASKNRDPREAPYKGRMLNLSETGCCAAFDRCRLHPLKTGDLYRACFSLPNDRQPFQIVAEIHWNRIHPAGDRIMVGMAWQLDPADRAHRIIQKRIARFITTQQRETLHRAFLS